MDDAIEEASLQAFEAPLRPCSAPPVLVENLFSFQAEDPSHSAFQGNLEWQTRDENYEKLVDNYYGAVEKGRPPQLAPPLEPDELQAGACCWSPVAQHIAAPANVALAEFELESAGVGPSTGMYGGARFGADGAHAPWMGQDEAHRAPVSRDQPIERPRQDVGANRGADLYSGLAHGASWGGRGVETDVNGPSQHSIRMPAPQPPRQDSAMLGGYHSFPQGGPSANSGAPGGCGDIPTQVDGTHPAQTYVGPLSYFHEGSSPITSTPPPLLGTHSGGYQMTGFGASPNYPWEVPGFGMPQAMTAQSPHLGVPPGTRDFAADGGGPRDFVGLGASGSSAIAFCAASSEAASSRRGNAAGLNRSQQQGVQTRDKPPGKSGRVNFKAAALDEMFANNTFFSQAYAIARDQAGCRMLQSKLSENDPETVNTIFAEIIGHMVELMVDPFGNYLCQKLMEVCNPGQLGLILDRISGDLVRISLNMHGARAVQKLIETVQEPVHVSRLCSILDGAVVTLVKDLNGNHVVQRCLKVLPDESQSFVFRSVTDSILDVATHRHGCCVLQRCIDAAKGSDRVHLTEAICRSALTLVQDPFGNYVVQYVLGLGETNLSHAIVDRIGGSLRRLSKQKFSSNVIEKCLQLGTNEMRAKMIIELCESSQGLLELLRDSYANYVVQRALSVATEPQFTQLVQAIRPVIPMLRDSGQGRRVVQKLSKKYPQLQDGGGGFFRAMPDAHASDAATAGASSHHLGTAPRDGPPPYTQGKGMSNSDGFVHSAKGHPFSEGHGGPSGRGGMAVGRSKGKGGPNGRRNR